MNKKSKLGLREKKGYIFPNHSKISKILGYLMKGWVKGKNGKD
jgi:hypothetical protein